MCFFEQYSVSQIIALRPYTLPGIAQLALFLFEEHVPESGAHEKDRRTNRRIQNMSLLFKEDNYEKSTCNWRGKPVHFFQKLKPD